MVMKKIAIIGANFYPEILKTLISDAIDVIAHNKMSYEVIEVPGSFEIPAALKFAINSNKFVAYVTLGCVIRGETTHYDHVCNEVARGVNEIAVQYSVPLSFGIITTENMEQALNRANEKHIGKCAAEATLKMLKIYNKYSSVT